MLTTVYGAGWAVLDIGCERFEYVDENVDTFPFPTEPRSAAAAVFEIDPYNIDAEANICGLI